MELQKLEKYKKEYKYFSNQISTVQSYLEKKINHDKPVRILPEQVSQALSISELDLIFIFSLAEKEHLLKKIFIVYSDNHEFLGKYESSNKIPNEIINNNTGEPVEKDNFYIDIAFELQK